MFLSEEKIKKFFHIFGKKISKHELDVLLKGEKKLKSLNIDKDKIEVINKYKFIFSLVPGLKAVFICNTVAFSCADQDSDIDLLVVTNNQQLWTCRIFLTLLTTLFGIRRTNTKIKNKFCLSFFATEDGALSLSDLQINDKSDPYLAIWTAYLYPVYIDSKFYNKFKKSNQWIKSYGLSFIYSLNNKDCIQNIFIKYLSIILKILLIEKLLKFLFLARIEKKRRVLKDSSGIIVSNKYLKFHNKDIRKMVLKKI